MKYEIKHKLRGFETFNLFVDIRSIIKSSKNRSYPNLSNCCGNVVKQKKLCGKCGNEVGGDFKFKQFKIGKQEFKVSAEHLKHIKDSLDSREIEIYTYLDKDEVNELFYTDKVFDLGQEKKHIKEYVELVEMIKASNKIGVGKFVYRNRPYPVMLFVKENNLMLRALHYEAEVGMTNPIEQVPINMEKVKLMVGVLKLNEKPNVLASMENNRETKENELIEMVINGNELPKIETIVVEENKASDEEQMEKLRALIN